MTRPDVEPQDLERFPDCDLFECPAGCVTDPFPRQTISPIRNYRLPGQAEPVCRRCGGPMENIRPADSAPAGHTDHPPHVLWPECPACRASVSNPSGDDARAETDRHTPVSECRCSCNPFCGCTCHDVSAESDGRSPVTDCPECGGIERDDNAGFYCSTCTRCICGHGKTFHKSSGFQGCIIKGCECVSFARDVDRESDGQSPVTDRRIVGWVRFDGDEYHDFQYQTEVPPMSLVRHRLGTGWTPVYVDADGQSVARPEVTDE